jgi:hypothetical protein
MFSVDPRSGKWASNWAGTTQLTAAGAGELCPYEQPDWDNGDRPYCGTFGSFSFVILTKAGRGMLWVFIIRRHVYVWFSLQSTQSARLCVQSSELGPPRRFSLCQNYQKENRRLSYLLL